jgi:hypothetical protein
MEQTWTKYKGDNAQGLRKTRKEGRFGGFDFFFFAVIEETTTRSNSSMPDASNLVRENINPSFSDDLLFCASLYVRYNLFMSISTMLCRFIDTRQGDTRERLHLTTTHSAYLSLATYTVPASVLAMMVLVLKIAATSKTEHDTNRTSATSYAAVHRLSTILYSASQTRGSDLKSSRWSYRKKSN